MSGIQHWRVNRTVISVLLTAGLLAAIVALVLLAFQATTEWRRSTALLVNQRSEEVLTLLVVALNRDMRGVHTSVLAPFSERDIDLDHPYDLADTFARAFAQFPYPESFFVWREAPSRDGDTYFFNRVDRAPPWDSDQASQSSYPVTALRHVRGAEDLLQTAKALSRYGRPFAAFDTKLANIPYQVIVHLMYSDPPARRLLGLVGFTVNLDWVRRRYFPELLDQIARIGGEDNLALEIVDASGAAVAGTLRPNERADLIHTRRFSFAFVDTALIGDVPHPATIQEWTAGVRAMPNRSLESASRGATRTLWLVSLASGIGTLALLITVAAVRANTRLATMKSEFVSSATHELKTPLALLQLVGDTLAQGRYHSDQTIRDYAKLISQECERLAHLIDNLLAFASLNDLHERYTFESLRVDSLIESALERFDSLLVTTEIEFKVIVPPQLPPVRADRQTMLQVLENVIDNALKYSPGAVSLVIRAAASADAVHIEVIDQGIGIPVQERIKVFQKFYRGQAVNVGGSGLGLAIVRKVVDDHGGGVEIRSNDPRGTIVDIWLPIFSSR